MTGTFYANETGTVRPYAGLCVGTITHDSRIDMGIFTSEETQWQFALRPELGVMIQPAQYIDFKLGAKYYQSFSCRDLAGQSTIRIDFGI